MLFEIEVLDTEFEIWESWCTTRYLEYACEIAKALIKEYGEEKIRIKQTNYLDNITYIAGSDITLKSK